MSKKTLSTAVMPGAHGSPKPVTTLDPAVVALLESDTKWRIKVDGEGEFLLLNQARATIAKMPVHSEARIAACAPELARFFLAHEFDANGDCVARCSAHVNDSSPSHQAECSWWRLAKKSGAR